MMITLWILNGLLAAVFLAAGLTKASRPKEALAASGMRWATGFAATHVKLIGLVEILGAIGLILPLPLLLNIAPVLTLLASVGLVVVMIAAVVVHRRRKESPVAPLVLAVLSVVSAVLGFAAL